MMLIYASLTVEELKKLYNMKQKYEIYSETGWNSSTQSPNYERITTVKNERAAIDFATNMENISRYGDMLIRMKSNGNVWTYNDKSGEWE